MKRLWWNLAATAVVIGMLVTGYVLFAPKPPIPTSNASQLTSTLLVPGGEAKIDSDTVRYDTNQKLLIFTTEYASKKVIVSEQPTPEQFIDIPQAYQKVLENMDEFQAFDVDVGTVHITRPRQLNGLQTAVLNSKGTLLFAKPDSDLSKDEWRVFFTQLEVQK